MESCSRILCAHEAIGDKTDSTHFSSLTSCHAFLSHSPANTSGSSLIVSINTCSKLLSNHVNLGNHHHHNHLSIDHKAESSPLLVWTYTSKRFPASWHNFRRFSSSELSNYCCCARLHNSVLCMISFNRNKIRIDTSQRYIIDEGAKINQTSLTHTGTYSYIFKEMKPNVKICCWTLSGIFHYLFFETFP